MVTQADQSKWSIKIWDWLRRDLCGFTQAFRKPLAFTALPPALYVYQLDFVEGKRRLHLKIAPTGYGMLFIDAMDVIHLNPTAAWLAKQALDAKPIDFTIAHLKQAYSKNTLELQREVRIIYDVVQRISEPTAGCLTCDLMEINRRDLFSKRATSPYKADLAITYGCNNSCSHCYNESDRFDMPSLTEQQWYEVIDKLFDVGVPHIIFTGGEATLHPELPNLIAYAEQLGQIVGLNTNGRRIAYKPYLQSLAGAGLNHIQVTLASHKAELHDAINGAAAFHQTVQGIENALSSDIHTITNTTLMQANIAEIETTIHFLHRLGIRTFAMNGMIYSGGGYRDPNAIPEAEMGPLLLQIRDLAEDLGMRFLWYTPTEYCRMSPVELEIGAKRCNAGEYSLCVEPNGDILPCQSYYTSAGNILRDPWEQIWQGDLFRSFRDREEDPQGWGLQEKCWECPDLPLCGGGCRIEQAAQAGSSTKSAGCSGCGNSDELVQLSMSENHDVKSNSISGFVPMGQLVSTANRSSGVGLK